MKNLLNDIRSVLNFTRIIGVNCDNKYLSSLRSKLRIYSPYQGRIWFADSSRTAQEEIISDDRYRCGTRYLITPLEFADRLFFIQLIHRLRQKVQIR